MRATTTSKSNEPICYMCCHNATVVQKKKNNQNTSFTLRRQIATGWLASASTIPASPYRLRRLAGLASRQSSRKKPQEQTTVTPAIGALADCHLSGSSGFDPSPPNATKTAGSQTFFAVNLPIGSDCILFFFPSQRCMYSIPTNQGMCKNQACIYTDDRVCTRWNSVRAKS